MTGSRTIETLEDRERGVLRVRLCDGDQVLAEREFSRRALVLDTLAREEWLCARSYMRRHDENLAGGRQLSAALCFNAAVRCVFPEFGTVPEGIETGT